jgi:hypothetical protein
MFDVFYVVEAIPQITRDAQSTKSYHKTCPPVRVKQYAPPAKIKNTLQIQQGITYAQINKQNSYVPIYIEKEPHTNQSYQRTSDDEDLLNTMKSLFEQMGTIVNLLTTVLTIFK